MAKPKTIFSCTECGGQTLKWQGQCPHCTAWNTLVESIAEKTGARYQGLAQPSQVQTLGQVNAVEEPRRETGIGELDRVLGGGLVRGGVTLLGGDPGIGKSTLLLQALSLLSGSCKALYVSGEESTQQLALRSRRLGLDCNALQVLAEVQLEKVLAALSTGQPDVAVVDRSRPCTRKRCNRRQASGCASAPRSSALRGTSAPPCCSWATSPRRAIAGPRVLEHMVDSVLYFEGDTHSSFRLVRATKNRFGAVNELGVFAMTDKGLRGVTNPSALFLSQHGGEVAGSCEPVTQEGTRPLLVEIQALVDESHAPNPRRLTVGLEQNRLAMLLAVLHRHAGVAAFDQDVFVNAVGGVRSTNRPPTSPHSAGHRVIAQAERCPKLVFGKWAWLEVQPVQRGQERLREAAKLEPRR